MDEKQFKERVEKAIANADQLTGKELRWVNDFLWAAKDAALMADATGNKDTRRRAEALAEKALSIVEERRGDQAPSSSPARAPRGQPPTARAGLEGDKALSIADSVALLKWHAEHGQKMTSATWKKIGFVRNP